MNLRNTSLIAAFTSFLLVLCGPWTGYANNFQIQANAEARAPRNSAAFEDETERFVSHAKKLIAKRDREGAGLDEKWYTLRRLQKHQEAILDAAHIVFYGGLEREVRQHLAHRYASVTPLEQDQDSGELRFFYGFGQGVPYDLIIVGQNGREVALKTVIRLIYLARFVDGAGQKYRLKIHSPSTWLRVFMSSRSARNEFIDFFHRYGIHDPDVVMIGFRRDVRTMLRREGMEDPDSYEDESLRVNWYPQANGKRLLLISIDGNRIFASRAGALLDAILEISEDSPPSVGFLGIGGAIDEPELVGTIVRPTIVISGDPFPAVETKHLVHILDNRFLDRTEIPTLHASVENVIVETTRWAEQMKMQRLRSVDQELFHIVHAVHASARVREMDLYAGILVTDTVSTDAQTNLHLTLEHAESTISNTSEIRQQFLARILKNMGVLKRETPMP